MTIAVGRDCRLTSDEYAEALINGLTDAGINVIDIGTCPTPLTYFSVFHFETNGAIMVTGSHNPAEYNGFKIGIAKDTLHGNQIQELKHIMLAKTFTKRTKGKVEKSEIINSYVNYVSNQIKPKRKLKVVLDAGNGTAATVAPLLFEKMGAEVTIAGPPILIPKYIQEAFNVRVEYNLQKALAWCDVANVLRIQLERQNQPLFSSLREYNLAYGISRSMLESINKEIVIMHPGPINRGVELDSDVADGPHSIILDQVENGVAVRMAVLYLLANRDQ